MEVISLRFKRPLGQSSAQVKDEGAANLLKSKQISFCIVQVERLHGD